MAPRMPVVITSTAVSEGRPPMRSAIPMAMGVVTDFGANDSCVTVLAPKAAATATADSAAVTEPATSVNSSGSARRLKRANWA
jgi:hypothetical protein